MHPRAIADDLDREATAEDFRVIARHLDRIFPEYSVDLRARGERLRRHFLREAAARDQAVVFRRVDTDVFDIGLRGSETRYKLTRPAFHAVHALLASRAPVSVCEFVSAGRSNPSDRLRNQIARARDWVQQRCPPLAAAFTFGDEGWLQIAEGSLTMEIPASAPRIVIS